MSSRLAWLSAAVALCSAARHKTIASSMDEVDIEDDGSNVSSLLDVESSEVVGNLDQRRILCPVLAALVKAGDMSTDILGNVEIADIRDAIRFKLGGTHRLGTFEAHGIVHFANDQKSSQAVRNRCTGACLAARHLYDSNRESFKRWLNIYDMNGRQTIEHGISTGTRGGATNMPFDDGCNGNYPCLNNFNKFISSSAKNNKFYLKEILDIICKARQYGDRGGEWSFQTLGELNFFSAEWNVNLVPAREWQMKGAMSAMLFTFGRKDAGGVYLTLQDMKDLFLHGKYRQGWVPTNADNLCLASGCEWPAFKRFRIDLDGLTTCPMGVNDPWWEGQTCESFTGKSCHQDTQCSGGAICVSRMCVCPRSSTGRSMCAVNGGCQSSQLPACKWFGKPCTFIPANNPATAGNP